MMSHAVGLLGGARSAAALSQSARLRAVCIPLSSKSPDPRTSQPRRGALRARASDSRPKSVAVAVTFPREDGDEVPPMRLTTSLQSAPGGGGEEEEQPESVFTRIQQGGEYNAERPRTLKINVDLTLYRARCARWEALRCTDRQRRKQLLALAERRFRRCIQMDPQDGRPYVGLAKLIEKARRVEEARALYEQGTKAVGSDNPFLWQAWATLEERQGNVARARALFDAATVADRSHAAAWHGWGMLEQRLGNLATARSLFLRGLKTMPPDRPNEYLYQSLAVLSAEMGRVEEARLYFREGTRAMVGVGRSAAALWQAWGMLEVRQGNPVEVRRLFDLGLKEAPKNRFLWLAWGVFEFDEGNVERARYLLSNGHKLNPRDPALLQAWARLEASQENAELARDLFQKGLKVDSQHQPLWQAFGMLEWQLGNLDGARDLFQKGVWADPRNRDTTRLFQAWGVLEGEAGNITLARQLFKCAVKADPTSLPSWQSWAALEESVGNERRADELRALCLQNRTEEEVDMSTPSMTLGVYDGDMAEGIVLSVKKIAKWFQVFDSKQQAALNRRKQMEKPVEKRVLPRRLSMDDSMDEDSA